MSHFQSKLSNLDKRRKTLWKNKKAIQRVKRNRNKRGVSTAGQPHCLNDPSLGKPESQDIHIPSQQLSSLFLFPRLFFPVSFNAETLHKTVLQDMYCCQGYGKLGSFTWRQFTSLDHLFTTHSTCAGRPLGARHSVQLVPIKASLAVQEEKSISTVPLLTPYIGSPSVRALSQCSTTGLLLTCSARCLKALGNNAPHPQHPITCNLPDLFPPSKLIFPAFQSLKVLFSAMGCKILIATE